MLICEFVDPQSVTAARVEALRDALETLRVDDQELVDHFKWAGPVLHRFPHVRVDLADVDDGPAITELVREAITRSGLTLVDVASLPNQFYVQRSDARGTKMVNVHESEGEAVQEATRLSAIDPDNGYRVLDDLNKSLLFFATRGRLFHGDGRGPVSVA